MAKPPDDREEPQNPSKPPPAPPPADAKDKTVLERGRTFSERVLLASDTLLKSLAAVGVFAVGKFGADRLGEGDYSGSRWLWALLAVVGFATGVAVAALNVFASYRASRVSHGWLLSDKGKAVMDRLDKTPYLYGGATSATDLQAKLTGLMNDQYADPVAFLTSPLKQRDRKQLEMLLAARRQTLDEALAENTQRAGFALWIGAGAALAALSASCFVYTTNQAGRREQQNVHSRDRKEVLEDRAAADVVTGSLLPKMPAQVRIRVPSDADPTRVQRQLSISAGTSCGIATVEGVLIAVSTPPIDDKTAVMRVVTLASTGCRADEVWLPPEWVVPAEPAAAAPAGTGSTTTTKPGTGSTTTTKP